MKVVAVGGGKGGTGKTTLAVALALSLGSMGYRVLLADLDVDNPCANSLVGADLRPALEVAAFAPEIDRDRCTMCGTCVERCPTHAILLVPGRGPMLLGPLCEGCGMCQLSCPAGAIGEGRVTIGRVWEGDRGGMKLVVGELLPGRRKSDEVLSEALGYALNMEERDVCVLDLPPGTGRGVYEALRASDLAVAVTEPTPLGAHDLDKFLRLVEEAGRPALVVINKCDMAGGTYGEVRKVAEKRGIDPLDIPYDKNVLRLYAEGRVDPGRAGAFGPALGRLVRAVVRALGLGSP